MARITVLIPIHAHSQSFVRTSRKMLTDGRWLNAAAGKRLPPQTNPFKDGRRQSGLATSAVHGDGDWCRSSTTVDRKSVRRREEDLGGRTGGRCLQATIGWEFSSMVFRVVVLTTSLWQSTLRRLHYTHTPLRLFRYFRTSKPALTHRMPARPKQDPSGMSERVEVQVQALEHRMSLNAAEGIATDRSCCSQIKSPYVMWSSSLNADWRNSGPAL